MLSLQLMTKNDYKDVFDFEQRNRSFFEQNLPPRPTAYNSYDSFVIIMDDLVKENESGYSYMCLLKEDDYIIGRFNIHSIKKGNCELGYRLDQDFQGKGFATLGVKMIIDFVSNKRDINLITAGTAMTNIGSQRVLEKNGFQRVELVNKVMKVPDQWIDGVVYQKLLK